VLIELQNYNKIHHALFLVYLCHMNPERPISDWLPLSLKEAEKRGWDAFDVILISGDAYVDHPSFGTAVIGRIIES
jgi:hypothetical protein